MLYERKVLLRDMPGRYGKALYIYAQRPDGQASMVYQNPEDNTATEKVFGPYEDMPPLLRLHPEELQLLADELQRLNIRPREASKTEGLYEAQSKHLADLRCLLKLKDA